MAGVPLQQPMLAGAAGTAAGAGSTGLDAAFLASWLQIDSATAERLSTDGAAAVAQRRSLMATASAAGTFGQAAVPGAYPPPLIVNPTTANFTSCIRGETTESFTQADKNTLIALIQQQAKLAGSDGTQTTILSTTAGDATCSGVRVRTMTKFPKTDKVPAQKFDFALTVSPGPSAPWLQKKFPGSTLSGFVITPSVPCTQDICKVCPIKAGVCTQCAASVGKPGTANYYTVYLTKDGKCKVCNAPGCATCKNTGKCEKCKAGFRNANGVCQRICADPLCASCPKAAKQCDRCKVSVGTYGKPTWHTVYMDLFKTCRVCKLYGCRVCRRTGTCLQCKFGFEPNGFGGCRKKTGPN
ncbi:serine threonine [Micractinium conductrix]|uniref:Serine threonine n=1 Tax=Micractinium conductrix TaxID=554055 RepID=A0A2P6V3J3_9CHLO|nr:serine threonine [Micractinium conductrix]|eukprot:PSC68663.1 serine threonine [Micractinium conductrix]